MDKTRSRLPTLLNRERQNMDTGTSQIKKIEDIPTHNINRPSPGGGLQIEVQSGKGISTRQSSSNLELYLKDGQLKKAISKWYHHNLTRNSAEVLLLSNGRQGSYLIRPSKTNPGNYTVSVKSLDSIKHFPLLCEGPKFVFGIGEFSNVEQLMEHFQNYPIIGGETGQPITLAHPYPSKVEEPSVYDDISRHAVCGSSFNCHWPLSTSNSFERDPKDINWTVASKEGFLTKQGAFHKNWKRRWFVTNRNTLQYYNERGDKNPIRVLDLRLAEEASKNNTCGKPNAFSLVFPNRTFLLCADTEQEMQEWIDLLKWKLDKIKRNSRSVSV